MRGSRCTAVMASADPDVCALLPQLLAQAGMELAVAVQSAADATRALMDFRPDLLICDAQLTECDGLLFAAGVLKNGALPVRPGVIVLYYPEFFHPELDRIRDKGAICLAKPLLQDELNEAIDRLKSAGIVFLPEETAAAERLLDELGFPAHPGRGCLKTAALLCAHDERFLQNRSRRLYPEVGRILNISPGQVEREIRSAIDAASGGDTFENLYRIFADTVDAKRGQPTSGEMIARLADILRMEG